MTLLTTLETSFVRDKRVNIEVLTFYNKGQLHTQPLAKSTSMVGPQRYFWMFMEVQRAFRRPLRQLLVK
jgi:hypothetical protein